MSDENKPPPRLEMCDRYSSPHRLCFSPQDVVAKIFSTSSCWLQWIARSTILLGSPGQLGTILFQRSSDIDTT